MRLLACLLLGVLCAIGARAQSFRPDANIHAQIAERVGLQVPFAETIVALATEIDPEGNRSVILTADPGSNTVETVLSTGFSVGDRITLTVAAIGTGLSLVDAPAPGADELQLRGANITLTTESVIVLQFRGTYWDLVSNNAGSAGSVLTAEFTEDEFTPTLSQTVFTLSDTYVGTGGLSIVRINTATYAETTHYTISGTMLTWLDTPFTLDTSDRLVATFQTQ